MNPYEWAVIAVLLYAAHRAHRQPVRGISPGDQAAAERALTVPFQRVAPNEG